MGFERSNSGREGLVLITIVRKCPFGDCVPEPIDRAGGASGLMSVNPNPQYVGALRFTRSDRRGSG